MSKSALAQRVDAWFTGRGWAVFPFQRAVWRASAQGQSGLLHASTGSGKTYAVWFGALLRAERLARKSRKQGMRVLWITPMRALAADTVRALQASGETLAPGWRIEARTGDTSAAQRARQAKAWPEVLVTTPESLSLMLSQADAQ
ncbi:MAG: DEAD/DEAH box helicase, partial [Janthinobacterium sp.]